MDLAELIYDVSKKYEMQESFILELSLEEYEENSVSTWMRFTKDHEDKVKITYKNSQFVVGSNNQIKFIMDMIYPNMVAEMMCHTKNYVTSDYSSLTVSLHNGRGQSIARFRHSLTSGISDIYVLDPMSWVNEKDLHCVAQTIHMTTRLACSGIVSGYH